MIINLGGNDWTLKCFYADCATFNMESGVDFKIGHIIDEIPATVPGSIHADLLAAGMIEDPFFGSNALKVEWVQHKNWLYKKNFCVEGKNLGKRAKLHFNGVNFIANFYLNGEKIGTSKNIHTPAVFEVGNLLKEENELIVLMENIPEDETQIGRGTKCKYQDQRYAYAWDFCASMISVGLFRDVFLDIIDSERIENLNIKTDYVNGFGKVYINGSCSGFGEKVVGATLSYEGKQVFCEEIDAYKSFAFEVKIENPELWYPNTYGKQSLYMLSVYVKENGKVVDEKIKKVGVRSITFLQNDDAPVDALPYTICINGRKIYSKGTIFLPYDQLFGRVTEEGYKTKLSKIKDANVNLLRLWGGGIFENEIFYDLCDEYGIMVWQDFMQSSSGLEGIPSKEPEFLEELKHTAEHILETVSNHVCATVYCGGNELTANTDLNRKIPVGYDDANIAMLKRAVEKNDGQKMFFPTTPCGPNFSNMRDEDSLKNKRNHNVHGPWYYMGIYDQYSDNNLSNCLYHGEVGADGMPSLKTLRKFLSQKTIDNYRQQDVAWRIHGGWWWNTCDKVIDVFGKDADNIEMQTKASQFLQAEGLRYVIARSRDRAFNCSGSNVWQFNEPWPNVCCSSLVDYYGMPKMAYFALKRAYAPISATLKYDSIYLKEGVEHKLPVIVSNLGDCEKEISVTAQIIYNDTIIAQEIFTGVVAQDGAKQLGELRVNSDGKNLIFVRLICDGVADIYAFGNDESKVLNGLTKLAKTQIKTEVEGNKITLTNVGESGAYFTQIDFESESYTVSDNYVTLLPGESVEVYYYNADASTMSITQF